VIIMPVDYYNIDQLHRVQKARKEAGLPQPEYSIEIDHPMVGRRVVDLTNGREYLVERVHKLWHWGWYTCLLLNHNGSHGMRFWDNLSSGDAFVQECCADSHRELEILDA